MLYGDTARLLEYRFDKDMASVIGKAVEGLFDWVQPERPEDLALIEPSGVAWLTTIAHERDAFVTMSDEQAEALQRECSRLGALLGPPRPLQ